MEKFTRKDATFQVLKGRTGSLAPHLVTKEYLKGLHLEVRKWLEAIEEALHRFDIAGDGNED